MDFSAIRFIHLSFLYWLVPLCIAVLVYRLRWYKAIKYRYSLVDAATKKGVTRKHHYAKKGISFFRLLTIGLLLTAALEPQEVDTSSRVKADGIDIVLALDVSGSMQINDFADDDRFRLEIAKDEAISFVRKRHNDAIGLTLFARDAVSRCPLTHDKKMLEDLIHSLSFDIIDPSATVLGRGMLTALNRLRASRAKSKIIILLTDGEPNGHDIPIDRAIKVAVELGVRVYTIGIGDDKPIITLAGIINGVNSELLQRIAQETGGRSYLARSTQDMRAIYESIDTLEKTSIETPLFTKYADQGFWLIIIAAVTFLMEIFLSATVWFGL